jgi:hypothetical protein
MASLRVSPTAACGNDASPSIAQAADSPVDAAPRDRPPRAQTTCAQMTCAGSGRQMGGMWQTNRFFVRRQFS